MGVGAGVGVGVNAGGRGVGGEALHQPRVLSTRLVLRFV